MGRRWDAIVVGLGAMGSATTAELAGRGLRVLGLDRFRPPHTLGSSHGETRIIREAYFEHPLYVPLVQRAFERWRRLEEESGVRLGLPTGGVMIGPPGGTLVAGALQSARQHDLAFELWTAAQLRKRFPAFAVSDEMVAVWEPRAGALFPERCIEVQLRKAAGLGAEIVTDAPVISWAAGADGVTVATAAATYAGRALVISAGAWLSTLVPALGRRLAVERQTLHWFAPKAGAETFAADRFPIFLLEDAPGRLIYGIPEVADLGSGVKVARHHDGATTSADTIDRRVHPGEVEDVDAVLARVLPGLSGGWQRSAVCMYTNAPDEHFIVDWLPGHGNVLIVSPCSGHGFKFSIVIGEIAADMVTGRPAGFDLAPFRLDRFG